MLSIFQHSSSQYSPRTRHNAAIAGLTVAFALDFNTRGEQLTKAAAGEGYLAVPLFTDATEAARRLVEALRPVEPRTLNVAGNGIHSLSKRRITQAAVNAWVANVLDRVHAKAPLAEIVSGGQTGVDIAGAVAGVLLGVKTSVTLPHGFIQRDADGVDRPHSESDIRRQVEEGAVELRDEATAYASAEPSPC
jgi:hypothetical protein